MIIVESYTSIQWLSKSSHAHKVERATKDWVKSCQWLWLLLCDYYFHLSLSLWFFLSFSLKRFNDYQNLIIFSNQGQIGFRLDQKLTIIVRWIQRMKSSSTRMMNFSRLSRESPQMQRGLSANIIIHDFQTHPQRIKAKGHNESVCVSISFLKLVKQFEWFVLGILCEALFL